MNIVLPELSYQIVGSGYNVHNALGYGHQEKVYQNAYEKDLIDKRIPYKREVYFIVEYNNAIVGKNFLDFLINDQVVVELKVAPKIIPVHLRQVLEYLRVTNKELAIILFFTRFGVESKRILNPTFKR